MKRLIGLLTLCVLIIIASVSAQASDITGHPYEGAVKMLSDFDIMQGYPDGNYHPDASITRAEFAALTVRFAGMDGVITGYYKPGVFTDVSQSDWYSDYAAFCKEIGYIDGYADGSFGGNDNITAKQAVKIVLSVMGYKNIAELDGGYPNGYLKIANGNGLLKGIGNVGDTGATRGEIACLLANALDIKIADRSYIEGKEEYYISDKTQLENLGYAKYSGYVDAVYSLSSQNGVTANGENEIIISGSRYTMATDRDLSEFFGIEVDFYVKEGKESIDNEIYHIAAAKDNKSLSVAAEDIADATTLSAFCYDNGSGIKTVNLSSPLIIYNGRTLTTAQMTDSVLKPENGSVTLLDSDSDNRYDKILVWEYSALVVRSISDDAIYAELSRSITLPDGDDIECAIVVYKNGKRSSLENIVRGDVVSAYVSKDGKYVRIVADGARVEGTVEGVMQDDRYEFVLDDGNTYTTENYYQRLIDTDSSRIDVPEPGDNVVLYLDSYGRIAFSELSLDDSGMHYGYLIDSVISGGLSSTLQIKYLNDSNRIIEAQVGKNDAVRAGYVDGTSYIVKRMSAEELYNIICPDGSTSKQLIKYVANDEGIITELYLVDVNSYGDIWGDCDEAYMSRTYAGNLFGQNYIVDQHTKIFYIPTNSAENVYRSGNAMAFLVYNKGYRASVYDVDNLHVGCLVVLETVASTGGYKYIIDVTNDDFMLIESASYVVDENGEEKLQLHGWIEGEKATVLVAKTLEANSEPISGLKKGKLIQFKTNASERKAAESADEPLQMIMYETRCDFTVDNDDEILWELVNISQDNSKLRTILGTISYRDENLVKINVSGSEYPIVVSDYARIVSYNPERNTGRLVTVDEMNEGKRVYVRQRYNNVIEVFILE